MNYNGGVWRERAGLVKTCTAAWIIVALLVLCLLCFCCSVSSSYIAMYMQKDYLCGNENNEEVVE